MSKYKGAFSYRSEVHVNGDLVQVVIEKGGEYDFDHDVADAILRDSPSVLVPVGGGRAVKSGEDRMVKSAEGDRGAELLAKSIAELRELAKAADVKASGSKKAIAARILEAEAKAPAAGSEGE